MQRVLRLLLLLLEAILSKLPLWELLQEPVQRLGGTLGLLLSTTQPLEAHKPDFSKLKRLEWAAQALQGPTLALQQAKLQPEESQNRLFWTLWFVI
jgi:hypothetical protein